MKQRVSVNRGSKNIPSLFSVHILQRKLQEEREKMKVKMFFNSVDCGI